MEDNTPALRTQLKYRVLNCVLHLKEAHSPALKETVVLGYNLVKED